MEIDFAMIDSKDSLLVGIDAERPANVHNAEVIAAAEAEYLNRLLALQKGIKVIYEPQLIENAPIEGEPEGWDEGAPLDVYEKKLEDRVVEATDILWYS